MRVGRPSLAAGAASAANVASLVLTGRIKVHWFRFGELQAFAQSYDYTTPVWVHFYRTRGQIPEADELMQIQWTRTKAQFPGQVALVDEDGNTIPPDAAAKLSKRRLAVLQAMGDAYTAGKSTEDALAWVAATVPDEAAFAAEEERQQQAAAAAGQLAPDHEVAGEAAQAETAPTAVDAGREAVSTPSTDAGIAADAAASGTTAAEREHDHEHEHERGNVARVVISDVMAQRERAAGSASAPPEAVPSGGAGRVVGAGEQTQAGAAVAGALSTDGLGVGPADRGGAAGSELDTAAGAAAPPAAPMSDEDSDFVLLLPYLLREDGSDVTSLGPGATTAPRIPVLPAHMVPPPAMVECPSLADVARADRFAALPGLLADCARRTDAALAAAAERGAAVDNAASRGRSSVHSSRERADSSGTSSAGGMDDDEDAAVHPAEYHLVDGSGNYTRFVHALLDLLDRSGDDVAVLQSEMRHEPPAGSRRTGVADAAPVKGGFWSSVAEGASGIGSALLSGIGLGGGSGGSTGTSAAAAGLPAKGSSGSRRRAIDSADADDGSDQLAYSYSRGHPGGGSVDACLNEGAASLRNALSSSAAGRSIALAMGRTNSATAGGVPALFSALLLWRKIASSGPLAVSPTAPSSSGAGPSSASSRAKTAAALAAALPPLFSTALCGADEVAAQRSACFATVMIKQQRAMALSSQVPPERTANPALSSTDMASEASEGGSDDCGCTGVPGLWGSASYYSMLQQLLVLPSEDLSDANEALVNANAASRATPSVLAAGIEARVRGPVEAVSDQLLSSIEPSRLPLAHAAASDTRAAQTQALINELVAHNRLLVTGVHCPPPSQPATDSAKEEESRVADTPDSRVATSPASRPSSRVAGAAPSARSPRVESGAAAAALEPALSSASGTEAEQAEHEAPLFGTELPPARPASSGGWSSWWPFGGAATAHADGTLPNGAPADAQAAAAAFEAREREMQAREAAAAAAAIAVLRSILVADEQAALQQQQQQQRLQRQSQEQRPLIQRPDEDGDRRSAATLTDSPGVGPLTGADANAAAEAAAPAAVPPAPVPADAQPQEARASAPASAATPLAADSHGSHANAAATPSAEPALAAPASAAGLAPPAAPPHAPATAAPQSVSVSVPVPPNAFEQRTKARARAAVQTGIAAEEAIGGSEPPASPSRELAQETDLARQIRSIRSAWAKLSQPLNPPTAHGLDTAASAASSHRAPILATMPRWYHPLLPMPVAISAAGPESQSPAVDKSAAASAAQQPSTRVSTKDAEGQAADASPRARELEEALASGKSDGRAAALPLLQLPQSVSTALPLFWLFPTGGSRSSTDSIARASRSTAAAPVNRPLSSRERALGPPSLPLSAFASTFLGISTSAAADVGASATASASPTDVVWTSTAAGERLVAPLPVAQTLMSVLGMPAPSSARRPLLTLGAVQLPGRLARGQALAHHATATGNATDATPVPLISSAPVAAAAAGVASAASGTVQDSDGSGPAVDATADARAATGSTADDEADADLVLLPVWHSKRLGSAVAGSHGPRAPAAASLHSPNALPRVYTGLGSRLFLDAAKARLRLQLADALQPYAAASEEDEAGSGSGSGRPPSAGSAAAAAAAAHGASAAGGLDGQPSKGKVKGKGRFLSDQGHAYVLQFGPPGARVTVELPKAFHVPEQPGTDGSPSDGQMSSATGDASGVSGHGATGSAAPAGGASGWQHDPHLQPPIAPASSSPSSPSSPSSVSFRDATIAALEAMEEDERRILEAGDDELQAAGLPKRRMLHVSVVPPAAVAEIAARLRRGRSVGEYPTPAPAPAPASNPTPAAPSAPAPAPAPASTPAPSAPQAPTDTEGSSDGQEQPDRWRLSSALSRDTLRRIRQRIIGDSHWGSGGASATRSADTASNRRSEAALSPAESEATAAPGSAHMQPRTDAEHDAAATGAAGFAGSTGSTERRHDVDNPQLGPPTDIPGFGPPARVD